MKKVKPTITLVCVLASSLLVAAIAQPACALAQAQDPIAVAQAFDAAMNAHDIDAAVALFADNATVHDADQPPGKTDYAGKAQIREWLAFLAPEEKFRIESSNYQANGNVVTYDWKVYARALEGTGLEPEDGSSTATVQEGKILSYSASSSPEWQARADAASGVGMPSTGEPFVPYAGVLALLSGLLIVGGLTLKTRRVSR